MSDKLSYIIRMQEEFKSQERARNARANRIIRSAEDIARDFADIAEELPRTMRGDYRIDYPNGDWRIIPRRIMEAAIDARKPKRSSIRAYMRANGRAQ